MVHIDVYGVWVVRCVVWWGGVVPTRKHKIDPERTSRFVVLHHHPRKWKNLTTAEENAMDSDPVGSTTTMGDLGVAALREWRSLPQGAPVLWRVWTYLCVRVLSLSRAFWHQTLPNSRALPGAHQPGAVATRTGRTCTAEVCVPCWPNSIPTMRNVDR